MTANPNFDAYLAKAKAFYAANEAAKTTVDAAVVATMFAGLRGLQQAEAACQIVIYAASMAVLDQDKQYGLSAYMAEQDNAKAAKEADTRTFEHVLTPEEFDAIERADEDD